MMKNNSSSFLGRLALRYVFAPFERFQTNRLPDRDLVVTTGGLQLKIFAPRTNRVAASIYTKGVWEPEVTGALRALIKPGDTIFDIGGDAGYYTVIFAKLVGPRGRVVVFEPIPKAQERIMENVSLNNFQNVEMVDLALGSKPGSFVLERPFQDSRINLNKAEPGPDDILVKVVRFDSLVQERAMPPADLIKIDVEGAELEILRGMEEYVTAHHPVFVIELHPQLLPQFGACVSDVITWLHQHGYVLTALDAGDVSLTEATTFIAR